MPTYPTDWVATMQPALHTWVDTVLTDVGGGWTTIWGEGQGPGETEQGPRVAKPFAILRTIVPPSPEIRSSSYAVDVSATRMDLRAESMALMTFEVQLFADTHAAVVTAAPALRHSVESSYPHRDNLSVAGLWIGEAILDRDLSTLTSGAREYRHALEFPMRLEMRTDYADQPWIETVTAPVLTTS